MDHITSTVGNILTEETVLGHPYFKVVERVVVTPTGEVRDSQLLWDRRGKLFAIAVVTDESGQFILVEESKYGQMRLSPCR